MHKDKFKINAGQAPFLSCNEDGICSFVKSVHLAYCGEDSNDVVGKETRIASIKSRLTRLGD